MGIYAGSTPIQRLWNSGEVLAVHIDGQHVWPDIPPDWLWQTEDSGVTLLRYLGSSNSVTIPAAVGGLAVTALAPTACSYTNAESVRIPSSVVSLY